MNTVIEPLTIGGGTGGGGWTMPPVITPVQMAVQRTCAAGSPSMITGPIPGQGPDIGGPITPQGTSISCVIGSPLRAAGNILTSSVTGLEHQLQLGCFGDRQLKLALVFSPRLSQRNISRDLEQTVKRAHRMPAAKSNLPMLM